MIKKKTNITVGISFVILTYIVALYLHGFIDEGADFFLFEIRDMLGNNAIGSLLAGTTLWILPKVLLSYYLANTVFQNYKKTYAYYFVRTRKPQIWMKRVFIQLFLSTCAFLLLKLLLAYAFKASIAIAMMAVIEILLIEFISSLIFIILCISKSEKIAVCVIILMVVITFMPMQTGNMELIQTVFLYENTWLSSSALILLNILAIGLIYQIVRYKEFYY